MASACHVNKKVRGKCTVCVRERPQLQRALDPSFRVVNLPMKRAAENQITKDNHEDEDIEVCVNSSAACEHFGPIGWLFVQEVQPTDIGFQKADEATLSRRPYVASIKL